MPEGSPLSRVAEPVSGARNAKGLLFVALGGGPASRSNGRKPAWPRLFPGFVPKTRQTLTFSATIWNDGQTMKTLAVIVILALLTISGAAYSDLLLTSDQRTAQRAN